MAQNLTRQQVIEKFGFDPEENTPAPFRGMTRQQVIDKYGFDPAVVSGSRPTAEQTMTSVLMPPLRFAAREGPKMIGAAGGAVLGAATGPYAPIAIPAFAAGGATIAEGMRQAIASVLDTGDQPKDINEAVERLVGFPSGAVWEGGMQELGTAYKAAKYAVKGAKAVETPMGSIVPPSSLKVATDLSLPLSPYATRAAEFGVPLSPAQRTQGAFQSFIEGLLRKTIGGPQVFRKLGEKQALAMNEAADDIVRSISPQGLSQLSWGEAIQTMISTYTKQFGSMYDDALKQISVAGGDAAKLNLSELSVPAKELLRKLTVPADFADVMKGPLGSDILHAIKILKAFSTPTKTVSTPASTVLNEYGKPAIEAGTQEVAKQLNFEGARRLRSVLFSLAHSGQVDSAKGAIMKMNEALDSSMGNALKSNNMSELYDMWHNASSNYRAAKEVVENKIIQSINANATPEEIAKGILSSGAESKLRVLSKVAPKLRRATAAAVFQAAYTKSLKDGMLLGDSLETILGDIPGSKLSNRALRILFPGTMEEHLFKIRRFINTVDTVNLKRGVTEPMSSQSVPLAAQGGAALGTGMLINVLTSGPQGLMLSLGGTATIVLAPMAFARLMTRPGAVDMATKALTTNINSAAGRALAYKLITLLEVAPQLPPAPPAIERALQNAPKPKETP